MRRDGRAEIAERLEQDPEEVKNLWKKVEEKEKRLWLSIIAGNRLLRDIYQRGGVGRGKHYVYRRKGRWPGRGRFGDGDLDE